MFPNCNKPVFVDRGVQHDFCGRTHAKQFEDMMKQKMASQYGYQNPQHMGPPPAYPGYSGHSGYSQPMPPPQQQQHYHQVFFFNVRKI